MEDRTSIWIGAIAGAIVGGAVGYLLLTENGRRLRADLQPRIIDLIAELGRAKEAAGVAREALADIQAGGQGHEAAPPRVAPASPPGWR